MNSTWANVSVLWRLWFALGFALGFAHTWQISVTTRGDQDKEQLWIFSLCPASFLSISSRTAEFEEYQETWMILSQLSILKRGIKTFATHNTDMCERFGSNIYRDMIDRVGVDWLFKGVRREEGEARKKERWGCLLGRSRLWNGEPPSLPSLS